MRKENNPPPFPPLSIVMYPNKPNPEIHLLSDDLVPYILLFLDVRVVIDKDRSGGPGVALVAIFNHTLMSHNTKPMRSYSNKTFSQSASHAPRDLLSDVTK